MKSDSTPNTADREADASVPHERHGLGNRNVGARLSEFFPDGSPRDPNFLAIWSRIRREALGGAVRRGGAPYFRVFETMIEGTPVHIHGPDRDPHDQDHFVRGLQTYGALGYGLLRGQLVVLPEQWRRSRELHERYGALIEEMAAAHAQGVPDPALAYVEGSRLIFWEALGFLLSVSEQLAVLVLGLNDWEGEQKDIGEAIVRRRTQPYRVFDESFFTSESWWRRQLQLYEDYDDVPDLSARQRELLCALSAESMEWVRMAVADLHNTWNVELHRVATRYKHSFTLLSASHGVAWPSGEQTAHGDLIGELQSNGALIVADPPKKGGPPVQLAVEVTIGGIEVLLVAVVEAVALTEALVSALLKRVEHVTGRVLPIHPFTINPEATKKDLLELAVIFSGMSQDVWRQSADEEVAKMRRHQAIRDAAFPQRASREESPAPGTVGSETSEDAVT